MDTQLLKKYIIEYKNHFDYINSEELYKWKAIKHFQEKWNIESEDFFKMLKESIKKTVNLLKSGQYYPLKMIMNLAEKEPETIRTLFINLYDEETDLEERIVHFQTVSKELNTKYFPENRNTYQDYRAIIVYLTLKYPEVYFLYKFNMFKDFSSKLKLTFKPQAAKFETLFYYIKICNIIRYHLSQDQELLKLHKNRITDDCYYDESLHVLTQDFIYGVARHLANIDQTFTKESRGSLTIDKLLASELKALIETINFTPRFVNFIANNIESKRIGDLGEIWVYEQEKMKLIANGLTKLADKVKHIANENGDGAGFDIQSYDLRGNIIFIEVKTTKYNFKTTFYVTRNELERSIKEKDKYFLYRVYKFDEETNQAECKIIQGELSKICIVPITYKVTLK